MPSIVSSSTPGRQRRIDRIRELRDRKAHPERYYGIFSVPNFARIGFLVFSSALAAGLVTAILGRGTLAYLVGVIAVGGAQYLAERVWQRFDQSAAQTWQAIKITLIGVVATLLLLAKAVPSLGISEFFSGWLADRNAALDRKQRDTTMPVKDSQQQGQDWTLITLNHGVRRGTLTEAREWCGQLGPGWGLPPSGEWPPLKPWPSLDGLLWVWTEGGKAQVGDGKPVGVFSSGSGRSSEVAGVICLYQRGANGASR